MGLVYFNVKTKKKLLDFVFLTVCLKPLITTSKLQRNSIFSILHVFSNSLPLHIFNELFLPNLFSFHFFSSCAFSRSFRYGSYTTNLTRQPLVGAWGVA